MGDLRLKVDLNKVSVQIYQSTAPSILEGGKPGDCGTLPVTPQVHGLFRMYRKCTLRCYPFWLRISKEDRSDLAHGEALEIWPETLVRGSVFRQ